MITNIRIISLYITCTDAFFIYIYTQSWPAFTTPWSAAHRALLSMQFFRQEYWSGLPCPPPRDLPDSGMEPTSPALHLLNCFTIWFTREKVCVCVCVCVCIIDMNICNILIYIYIDRWAYLVAQLVKNPCAMQETSVWFLGPEDPL